jgi:hypothetical protein
MRDALETLYLDRCERTGHDPAQEEFEQWASRCEALAADAIGRRVAVRMRKRPTDAARRIVVKGTVKSVEPHRVRLTRTTATVVWRVTLDSGRVVHLTRI